MRILVMILAGALTVSIISCRQVKENKEEAAGAVDSVSMLSQQIAKDSSDYKLFLDRARVYLNQGAINPAFRDVNSALERNKMDPEVYNLLADLYFIIGKADEAVGAMKKAVEIAPSNVQYLLKISRIYIMLRNYNAALRYIDQVLSMDFQNAQAYYLKGVYLLEQGDTLDAITHMKIAGSYDTTFYETFMHTASLLNNLNDSTAIGQYRKALNSRPDDKQALFLLGLSYQDYGKYDQALDCYFRLKESDPGLKQVYYNMGYIYLVEKRDFQLAEENFLQAINLDPAYVDAVYNLGRTYEAQARYDEARQQYRMALQIRKNYELAIEGLNRLESNMP
jgi:tetratricopeptide (TPR) repeat protein